MFITKVFTSNMQFILSKFDKKGKNDKGIDIPKKI